MQGMPSEHKQIGMFKFFQKKSEIQNLIAIIWIQHKSAFRCVQKKTFVGLVVHNPNTSQGAVGKV